MGFPQIFFLRIVPNYPFSIFFLLIEFVPSHVDTQNGATLRSFPYNQARVSQSRTNGMKAEMLCSSCWELSLKPSQNEPIPICLGVQMLNPGLWGQGSLPGVIEGWVEGSLGPEDLRESCLISRGRHSLGLMTFALGVIHGYTAKCN